MRCILWQVAGSVPGLGLIANSSMNAIRTSFLPVLLFCIAIARWSSAQSQLDAEAITKVSICDLYTDPARYQGKTVAVHVSLAGSDLWIDDFSQPPCSYWTNVVLVYPEQVKPNPDFFGRKHTYGARIVLQRISDVTAAYFS